jgi:hypothetical protein
VCGIKVLEKDVAPEIGHSHVQSLLLSGDVQSGSFLKKRTKKLLQM